jgi:hypothetical protein
MTLSNTEQERIPYQCNYHFKNKKITNYEKN